MDNQDIYYDKYIKYKTKYLELKEQSGGRSDFTDPLSGATIPWICKPLSIRNKFLNLFDSDSNPNPNLCKIYNNRTFQDFHNNLKNNLITNLRLDLKTRKTKKNYYG
jgi:hypothetical protein